MSIDKNKIKNLNNEELSGWIDNVVNDIKTNPNDDDLKMLLAELIKELSVRNSLSWEIQYAKAIASASAAVPAFMRDDWVKKALSTVDIALKTVVSALGFATGYAGGVLWRIVDGAIKGFHNNKK